MYFECRLVHIYHMFIVDVSEPRYTCFICGLVYMCLMNRCCSLLWFVLHDTMVSINLADMSITMMQPHKHLYIRWCNHTYIYSQSCRHVDYTMHNYIYRINPMGGLMYTARLSIPIKGVAWWMGAYMPGISPACVACIMHAPYKYRLQPCCMQACVHFSTNIETVIRN